MGAEYAKLNLGHKIDSLESSINRLDGFAGVWLYMNRFVHNVLDNCTANGVSKNARQHL